MREWSDVVRLIYEEGGTSMREFILGVLLLGVSASVAAAGAADPTPGKIKKCCPNCSSSRVVGPETAALCLECGQSAVPSLPSEQDS
jgi:hypothetical protein